MRILILMLLTCPLLAQPTLSPEEMNADLEQLAAAVRSTWSYLEYREKTIDLDLDRLTAAAREKIDGVRDDEGFRLVLAEFVADLRDGHAGLSVPGSSRPRRYLPFEVLHCGENFLVGRVTWTLKGDDVPALGDRLLKIDGEEVGTLFERLSRRVFSSTDSGRAHNTVAAMGRSDRETVPVVWCDSEGKEKSAAIPTSERYVAMRGGPVARGNWDLRFPGDKVALLRIWSFAAPDQKAWRGATVEQRDEILAETKALIDQRIEEIAERGAETLIIDLRRNPGGTDLLGIHLARHLIEGKFRYFRLSAKHGERWTRPSGLAYERDESMVGFDGRVLALIDGGVFSTADNFLRALSDLHPRFETIGRPTGGGTGAPRQIVTLEHSKATITLCTQRVHGPKSGIIEGRGTDPGHPVLWTAEDLRSGRDPDLALALELAAESASKPADGR